MDISKHLILKQAYDLGIQIEHLGASDALTDASVALQALAQHIEILVDSYNDALGVLQMVDDNYYAVPMRGSRVRKQWDGKFVAEEVSRILGGGDALKEFTAPGGGFIAQGR